MFKMTKKVRDHLAEKVLTPISLAVGGFLCAHGWSLGNVWVLLYGIVLFSAVQCVAVMLIAYDGEDSDAP